MPAILDIPEIRAALSPLSVSAYHRLGDMGEIDKNVELIRGFLVEKMSKSPLHEFLAGKLFRLLNSITEGRNLHVRKEAPITAVDSEPEPDISVVTGSSEDYVDQHPPTAELVIEVAISSKSLDADKGSIYAEAGVKEYWIVRPEDGETDVFTDPESGIYKRHLVYGENEEIVLSTIEKCAVRLTDLMPPQA